MEPWFVVVIIQAAGTTTALPVLVIVRAIMSDSNQKSTDIIYLRDLKVECIIGIFDWERRSKQKIHIDIDMASDISKAAQSDKIEDTLDYKAVSKRLLAFVGDSGFQLVETLAERVAALVLEEFPTPWVRVRINKKGAVRGATDVGVIIERGSKP